MNKPVISKWVHEPFSQFFEEPTRETLGKLIQISGGEDRKFDFKAEWPEGPKLARHVLALANSGGGCIVVGVREAEDGTLKPEGLEKVRDKAVISSAIKSFVPQRFFEHFNVVDFVYGEAENPKLAGKKFQVAFVETHPALLPFISAKTGEGIRGDAIYVRRGTESTEANDAELTRLIEKKIESSQPDRQARNIKEHLAELKILFEQIPRKQGGLFVALKMQFSDELYGVTTTKENPKYPKEDYEDFVVSLVAEKKFLIRRLLGV